MDELESQSDYILQLAKELLEDIELSRVSVENSVLKASRLARLIGDQETIAWLHYEMFGYSATDKTSLKIVRRTGRWIDYNKKQAYWGPIAQQEAVLTGYQAEVEVIKGFTPSGEFSLLQLQEQQQKIAESTSRISQISAILSRVRALIQNFAARVLQERLFSGQAEEIFESYKREVDALLAQRAGDALDKLPHIFERLSAGDKEAISQALLTCRRVIDNFADAVYPSREGTDVLGGQEVKVGPKNTKNRFRLYVEHRVTSQSRKEKIFKIFGPLYDRTSTGVHDDIDAGEARALVLQTYLLLGEVLSLGEPPAIAAEEADSQAV